MLSERFKKAREFLGISQSGVARKIGLTSTAINQFESGKSTRANFDYAIYLIENGINPYFLIGASDEVTGQKLEDFVPKAEHEKLKAEFEDLLHEHKTLQNVLKILQIEVDEDGNVKKKT